MRLAGGTVAGQRQMNAPSPETIQASPVAFRTGSVKGDSDVYSDPETAHAARSTPAINPLLPGVMGLRGVAALMIVLFHLVHLASNVEVPPVFGFIKTHFGMGVPLFFVLSGFSLMYSTKPHVGRPDWIVTYVLKRVFRIAPLFYMMLALFTVYNFFVLGLKPAIAPLIINALFLHNLVPGVHESIVSAGWTLGVEMLFYAVFPVLLVVVTTVRRGLALFVVCTAASFASRALLANMAPASYASFSFAGNLFYFAAGIAAYLVYERLAASRVCHLPLGAVCTLLAAVVVWTMLGTRVGEVMVRTSRLDLVAWAIFFGLVCVWQALWPSRLLSCGFAQFCGRRSYSIYLVHPMIVFRLNPTFGAVYGLLGAGLATFLISSAIGVAAVLVAAAVAYRAVEEPGIRLGARLAARVRPPGAASNGETSRP